MEAVRPQKRAEAKPQEEEEVKAPQVPMPLNIQDDGESFLNDKEIEKMAVENAMLEEEAMMLESQLEVDSKDPESIQQKPQLTIEKIQQMQDAYEVRYPSLSYGNLAELPEHQPYGASNKVADAAQQEPVVDAALAHQRLIEKAKAEIKMLREEAAHAAYPGLTTMAPQEMVGETEKPPQEQIRYSIREAVDPQNVNQYSEHDPQDFGFVDYNKQIENDFQHASSSAVRSVVRQSILKKNEELKKKLHDVQGVFLSTIPEEQREKVASQFQSRQIKAKEVSEGEFAKKKKEMLKVKGEDLELRTVNLVDKGSQSTNFVEVIVHKVDPKVDTLFKLSYMYKTSKREIQRVNQFEGEEIFFMREILIPYKGQEVVLVKPDPEDQKRKDQEMKINMLSATMRNIERQYRQDPKKKKHFEKTMQEHPNFHTEARFYLEQNDFDYEKAAEQFKGDLLFQLQFEQSQRESTVSSKSGKRKKKCEIF